MTTAALYVRQSLDRSGEGLAVARQEDECRAWCTARGWAVGEVYSDNDISATTGKVRPAFERLLLDKPDAVVTWHQDRLLRLSRDLERVLDAGLTVHSVQASSLDLSSPHGKAVSRTIAAWTTYEGEQKSARQKASSRQRVSLGKPWWPFAPMGYEKDGTLSPHAPLVREAYEQVLAGGTIAAVTRTWNEAGALSPRGKPWIRTSVLAVLKSPRNAGLLTYHGAVMGTGTWEPIVDEGTFQAVLAVLADPVRGKGGGARKNLLTGIARCGLCGLGMVACTQGAAPHRYRAYRCPTGHLSVKGEWLEALVLDAQNGPQKPRDPQGGPKFRHHVSRPSLSVLASEAAGLREIERVITAALTSGKSTERAYLQGLADIERRQADLDRRWEEEIAKPQLTDASPWVDMTREERAKRLRHTGSVVVGAIPRYTRRTPDSVTVTTR
jgi:DNA invertase Pin-like site-specific DNA recombinase